MSVDSYLSKINSKIKGKRKKDKKNTRNKNTAIKTMSDVVDIQAKDGTVVLKYKMYDGMYMSLRARDVEERFRTLKTLKYKEGDVLIISYPKTGKLSLFSFSFLFTHLSFHGLCKKAAELQVTSWKT